MTKKEAINALEEVGLKYNFVTRSSSKEKNTVIDQSISAGSKVSEETTITVTLSSGKKVSHREESDNDSNDSGNSSKPGSSGNSSSKPSKPESDSKPVKPSCDKSKGDNLNIQAGNTGTQTKEIISQLNPNHKFRWNLVNSCPNGDITPGTVCDALEGQWKNFCDTITVTIVK